MLRAMPREMLCAMLREMLCAMLRAHSGSEKLGVGQPRGGDTTGGRYARGTKATPGENGDAGCMWQPPHDPSRLMRVDIGRSCVTSGLSGVVPWISARTG
jgi:hypothetical protein